MNEPLIVSVTIGTAPDRLDGPMPTVDACFSDQSTKTLFWFYPDEISFTPEELVGLTETQARQLKQEKDRQYLLTPARPRRLVH